MLNRIEKAIDWFFTGNRIFLLPVVVVALLALLLSGPVIWYTHGTLETRTETIQHKERVCSGGRSGDCFWIVFTDLGEYQNSDSLLHLKFNSTTLQRELPLGEEITFITYGRRVPFFSMYPNIVKIQE